MARVTSNTIILRTLALYKNVLKRPFLYRRKLKGYFVLGGKKASGFDIRLSELKDAGVISIQGQKIFLIADLAA